MNLFASLTLTVRVRVNAWREKMSSALEVCKNYCCKAYSLNCLAHDKNTDCIDR